ncbi:MAG: hypothetical protein GY862_32365, partial [Gammaproteobacteria bacterium]|nr:hypothetical protein [Gammaproteobacteria bacterium]MCP4701516.1 hypothetical protein [Gammaproteobacteria bacterium]
QIANYFLIPRFGPVSESVAKLFIQHCQGYMSEADELAKGITRFMDKNPESKGKLTADIVKHVAAALAKREV